MELTEQQKQSVKQWVEEGCGLSEIQRRLGDNFNVSATYMDVRFLILDMGLEIHDETERRQPTAGEEAEAPVADVGGGPQAGGVSVEVDVVTKPGSLVSGTVTFSDGVSAAWSVDQMGRLTLEARQAGYKPSAEDLQVFQRELKSALERKGL
ncbi:MAG: hypothetical protein R6V03_03865 [Kiritimatiellia bacterium]